jgi:O-antigen/teichoic acid export membrane protein
MSEEMHHTLDCSHTFRRLLKPMLLSFFPFLFIFILAPDLFAFLFGESWRSAGYFTRLMAPYFFFKFLAVPFCPLYSLAMRQREEFLLQFYLLASTLLIIYSGTSGFVDIHSMILLFSLNYSGVYLMNIIRTYSFSRQLGANYQ